ncbi:MAG: response regulator, partial [Bacteroidia bacterium]
MDSKKINVLYIDDEMANLVGFKASFREIYNIHLAKSSIEALAILNDHPEVQVVISDQRMPDKTGVELFETIRKTFPLPVRILCTAYTDIEAVIDASAMARAVVEKPVMIIAHTVPGMGVDFMEYDFHWH